VRLSKPVEPYRLKQRRASNKSNEMLSYLPWYQAAYYLDHSAPGWCYEVRSITTVGAVGAVTVRITIPAMEGLIFREATAPNHWESKGYGDPTINAESMILRRAGSKLGLC